MCVPAVIGIAGGIVSGIGAAMGAKAEANSLDAQAQFKERQAAIEHQTGEYQAGRTQDAVDRTTGAQRAGFAASGVGLTGSAADVIMESETEGKLDVAAIRWNSKLAGDNLRYQAKMDKMNAQTARRSAPLAFLGATLNGIASYGGDFATGVGLGA